MHSIKITSSGKICTIQKKRPWEFANDNHPVAWQCLSTNRKFEKDGIGDNQL
jgi:hypothetical protein